MSDTPQADNLQSTFVVMNPSQEATRLPVTDTIWQELDERFDNFQGHVLVSSFTSKGDWPTWEMHPKGDETVCLLSGCAVLKLREGRGEREVTLEKPGDFVVVPRGTWHTARIAEQTSMLFVTPGEGTQNRESPPG